MQNTKPGEIRAFGVWERHDPTLRNVTISPHAAGHTEEGQFKQGRAMVDEIGRHWRGEPLRHEVSEAMLANMT